TPVQAGLALEDQNRLGPHALFEVGGIELARWRKVPLVWGESALGLSGQGEAHPARDDGEHVRVFDEHPANAGVTDNQNGLAARLEYPMQLGDHRIQIKNVDRPCGARPPVAPRAAPAAR